jgi:hypothetical protein
MGRDLRQTNPYWNAPLRVLGNLPDDVREFALGRCALRMSCVTSGLPGRSIGNSQRSVRRNSICSGFEMNRMRANGRSLPGFLRGAAVANARRSRDRDADFHSVYAALKVAVLMLRYLASR